MKETVRAILARLEPIKDKVFLSPMSDDELSKLEQAIGLPIPGCLREYLRLVGVKQDLTWFEASDYEELDRVEFFVGDRKALIKLFDGAASRLFPFARDGAGDYIAVVEGKDCSMLVFADHETKKIKEIGNFCDWLAGVVNKALKQDRALNKLKRRYVQFSFKIDSPEPIIEVLSRFARSSLGPWTAEVRGPSGVDASEAPLAFGSEHMKLGKLNYWTWEKPMFSFDFDEPAGVAAEDSRIEQMSAAFKSANLGYSLGDYGVHDSEAMQKIEEAEKQRKAKAPVSAAQAGKRPLWKVW